MRLPQWLSSLACGALPSRAARLQQALQARLGAADPMRKPLLAPLQLTPMLPAPPPPPIAVDVTRTLFCVLPYFNYAGFERRRQLFLEFVARYAETPGLALVVIEAAEAKAGQPARYDLPEQLPGVYLHFRVATQDPIWIKECLVNVAAARLPAGWRALAWVDADLTFLSASWADDALRALAAEADVLQLFATCSSLGPEGEVLKTDKGFGFQHRTSRKPYDKRGGGGYDYWHPGYAWACSRRAYEAMGGLFDLNILGSGDYHMAMAFVGLVEQSRPDGVHPDFKRRLQEYQARVQAAGLRLSYVKGTVVHHWHGRAADRKYVERWEVLVAQGYSPSEDVGRNHRNGALHLTAAGKRLVPALRLYFQERAEDRREL